jgi:hypothetical protein
MIFTDTVRTVNFSQQTDVERLRVVWRQAVLGIAYKKDVSVNPSFG